jgi:hypothetical protein
LDPLFGVAEMKSVGWRIRALNISTKIHRILLCISKKWANSIRPEWGFIIGRWQRPMAKISFGFGLARTMNMSD